MNSILGNGQIDEIEVHTLTDWIQIYISFMRRV